MTALLTPRRRRGVEYLDEPSVDPKVRRRSHRDIALANKVFGGAHAVFAELRPELKGGSRTITLLDVGTGTGDIPARFAREASTHGIRVEVLGVDDHRELVAATRDWPVVPVCADALSLPFADSSIDVVFCSQTLHHFVDDDAITLIREMDRVARRRVLIADLRRSWFAVGGLWSLSFPLGFHPVSRHDGVVSILRGYTGGELRRLVRQAIGRDPAVHRRLLFRITASWVPAGVARRASA
jgi:ubiquinone/menaquinone biosynthesis C-methylase UbiE